MSKREKNPRLNLPPRLDSDDLPNMVIDRQGIVKWFDQSKGFGLIQADLDGDVFVHYREIDQPGFR